MKVLFITTSSLASNPRLIKEIELATENSFEISVVYFKINGWSEDLSKKIKNNFVNIQFYEISATRSPFFSWLFSSLIEFFLRKIPTRFLSTKFLAYSINKRTYLLSKKLEKIKKTYDWVIAHNSGAFYPAQQFAKKKGTKLGIDVEDYHPGESSNSEISLRISLLMHRVLIKADYCSFASPLIEEEVKNKITNEIKKSIIIINGFNGHEFRFKESNSDKLKLVWYSQNIDFGRGLEKFIPILSKFSQSIYLTIIGDLNPKFESLLEIKKQKNIQILNPISQIELNNLLAEFDVGLALEPGKDRNNEIALSNKIISYVQAGLYVIAFPTLAQKEFMKKNTVYGRIIQNDSQVINECLLELIKKKEKDDFKKLKQFHLGKQFSWQNISKPLIQEWMLEQ